MYIIGTDWAGNVMTEKITLNGSSTVAGSKPFRTVTKVILPSYSGSAQVAVGTTNKLGLQFPIATTSDVQQQGRKASSQSAYTLETVGTVDSVYSTVQPDPNSGDCFEWAIRSAN